jgi:hypothetical protein
MATRACSWLLKGSGVLLLVPGAAEAQPAPAASDPLRIQVLTRECEGARGDEIVVCGNRERRSPFRLPEEPDQGFDPRGTMESVSEERNAMTEHGARTGPGSCSTVGPGGAYGCAAADFRREVRQHGGRPIGRTYRRGRR